MILVCAIAASSSSVSGAASDSSVTDRPTELHKHCCQLNTEQINCLPLFGATLTQMYN